MPKYILILLLVIVLPVTAICNAHQLVNYERDTVTITEAEILGDKNMAEGITFEIRSGYHNDILFWNTSYTISEDSHAKTTFSYNAPPQYGDDYSYLDFSLLFNGNMSGSSSGSFPLDEDRYLEYALLADLATRTLPGESGSEEMRLADYYDHYLLEFRGSVGGKYFFLRDDVLNDYFKIPVPEDYLVEALLYKDEDGNITDIGMSEISGHCGFESVYTVTDKGIYFTFTDYGLDLSRIEGGYGVYFVEFIETRGDVYDLGDIEMVYPLESSENIEIVGLSNGLEEGELLLLTRENGEIVLTVLDIQDLAQVQKIPLFEAADKIWIEKIHRQDDFIVLISSNEKLTLITKDSEEYGVKIAAELSNVFEVSESIRSQIIFRSAFAYDGTRLALVASQDYGDPDVCLAVFTQEGLAYLGAYGNGLSDVPYYGGYIDYSSIDVSLK